MHSKNNYVWALVEHEQSSPGHKDDGPEERIPDPNCAHIINDH